MAKRSIWKAKFEATKEELSRRNGDLALAQKMIHEGGRIIERQRSEISGLCDALRATAEQLEVRDIHDTARHIRRIADNYSPAQFAVRGEAIKR